MAKKLMNFYPQETIKTLGNEGCASTSTRRPYLHGSVLNQKKTTNNPEVKLCTENLRMIFKFFY